MRPLKTLAVSFVNALLVVSALAWNAQSALAQTAALVPNAKQQFFNANGDPLAGGSVYSYVPNTTTPKTTWIDPFEATPNANPVVLDAGGSAFIFGQGNYRQVVKDANGNLIWDGFTSAYGSSAPSGSNGTDTAPVGTVMPFAGSAVPVNWQLAYGQALSRTTFAQLETAITIGTSTGNAVSTSTTISGFASTAQVPVGAPIECSCLPPGTTVASITNATTLVVSQAATATGTFTVTVFPWGNGDGVTTFNVPDLRGRTFAGADAMGGTAASRLTSAFYGASASTPGVAGGAQSNTASTTLAAGNIPQVSTSYTPAGTIAITGGTLGGTNSLQANLTSGTAEGPWPNNSTNISAGFTGTPATITVGSASPSAATSAAFGVIQPTLTVNYIIKVAPNTTGAGGVTSLGGMFGDIVCASTLTCAPTGSPSVNTIGCTTATVSQLGCVRPDGTTVTISAGVLTAVTTVGQITVGSTPVQNGTSNLPLIDVSGVLQQGTVSGNTTKFGTVSGALTNGHCIQADANGNLVDSGSTGCGGGTSSPVSQAFVSPGAVTSLTLTNTPLPGSSGMVTVYFDGRAQARSTWSINVVTGVITFGSAIPANTGVVEVDWWAPNTFAGISSLTIGASTLTGAVTLVAGSNITLTPSGQNITVAAFSGIGGSGTANKLPLWVSSGSQGNSIISQDAGATTATVNGQLVSNAFRNYADISQFGTTPPVCNAASPTQTNVAAAAIAAYNAGYRAFYIPPGCFIFVGDSVWTTKFGSQIIPANTWWRGGDWQTSGFSVCSVYSGCTPSPGNEITAGSQVILENIFYMSYTCYNLDGGTFGRPPYCPLGLLNTGTFSGGNVTGYPFQPINLYMAAQSLGPWNGTDSPVIGITNGSQGDGIFIDNTSGVAGVHLLNFFGIGGTVGTWNADGHIEAGNSSTAHGSGIINVQDNTSNGTYFPGNTTWTVTSDRRLKTEIRPDKSELGWLASFDIRRYRWRKTGALGVGPIAQELQEKHPELVHIGTAGAPCDPGDTARQKGCWTVDTPDVWQMLRAMQEMQSEIVALKHAQGRRH